MSAAGQPDVADGAGDGVDGAGAQPPSAGQWQGYRHWTSWDPSATMNQQSQAGSQRWMPEAWHSSWWQGQWERPPVNNWGYSYSDRQSSWPGYRWSDREAAPQQWSGGHEREVQDETGHRRASVQSTTVTDDTGPETLEEPKESSDAGSQARSNPKTGKDHVPEFDGKSAMRDYERRVRLFESATGIDPCYRAQKLMERLTGAAWTATESLDLQELQHEQGVQRLLRHLYQELEPLEHLRVLSTLSEFYRDFKRTPGQEFVAYDMEFRIHLKRLEEIGAKLEGLTKAYWFLEKAGLSADLRKQVVSASGGEYDYVKLRRALMAIVPKVKREDDTTSAPRPSFRQWKGKNGNPKQVHATTEEDEDAAAAQGEDQPDEVDPEELESELEVLLTQAARKRAKVERARGSAKGESSQARESRIKEMKSRMPCSACKSHGKTVFGQWHSDAECPYNKKGGRDGSKVLAVVSEQLSDSEDDDDLLLPTNVYLATSEDPEGEDITEVPSQEVWASADATTEAGRRWIERHIRLLQQQGEDVFIVNEARPFRFGGGPRVMSDYAALIPLQLDGAKRAVTLRVSVVDQEIPLLLSKAVLKQLGMVMDLDRGVIDFREIQTQAPLRETKAGLCGFQFNTKHSGTRLECPPDEFLDEEREIYIWDGLAHEQVCMMEENAKGPHSQVRATPQNVQSCEEQARRLYHEKDYSFTALLQLVRSLPIRRSKRHRCINDGPGRGNEAWVAGLFSHGGWTGVTRRTTRYPNVVRYLNMFMQHRVDGHWTSMALLKNVSTDVHVDCHNRKDAKTVSMTFGSFSGGQLWMASESVISDMCVWKQNKEGNWLKGELIDTYQKPQAFDPHVPHATHEWEGERWCLSVYTVRSASQVDDDTWKALKKLGFPIGKSAASRTLGKQRHVAFMSSNHQEPRQSDDVNASDDDEPNDTPQRKISDHQKPEIAVVTPPAPSCDHVSVDAHPEEEGGVCGGDRESLPREPSRSSSSHSGSVEGAVDGSAPTEEGGCSSPELEEAGCAGTARAVFESCGGGPGTGSGPPLGEVVSQPAHHGAGNVVGGRCRGSPDGPRSGNVGGGTHMPDMPHRDDPASQSTHQRAVLGLQEVPCMQEHSRTATTGSR